MSAMEVTEHDKSKRNANAKMAVLPSDDPRCHGLEEGFCRMACDTCPFVTRPIKNEYLNKWRRQQAADLCGWCFSGEAPPVCRASALACTARLSPEGLTAVRSAISNGGG